MKICIISRWVEEDIETGVEYLKRDKGINNIITSGLEVDSANVKALSDDI